MINDKGAPALLGPQGPARIKDDRVQPETRWVTDYNALISGEGRPACAARSRHCATFGLGRRRRAKMLYVDPRATTRTLQARLQDDFFAQKERPPTRATCGPNGIVSLPADQRPRRPPLPDAPTTRSRADVGGHRGILKPAGIQTVYRRLHGPTPRNSTRSRAADQGQANPTSSSGHEVRGDGVGLGAPTRFGFTPKWL